MKSAVFPRSELSEEEASGCARESDPPPTAAVEFLPRLLRQRQEVTQAERERWRGVSRLELRVAMVPARFEVRRCVAVLPVPYCQHCGLGDLSFARRDRFAYFKPEILLLLFEVPTFGPPACTIASIRFRRSAGQSGSGT